MESDEMIKCQLCEEDVVVGRSKLKDHIAGEHFGHAQHHCQDCEQAFTSGKMAMKHAGLTRHRVVLNGVGALDHGFSDSDHSGVDFRHQPTQPRPV